MIFITKKYILNSFITNQTKKVRKKVCKTVELFITQMAKNVLAIVLKLDGNYERVFTNIFRSKQMPLTNQMTNFAL